MELDGIITFESSYQALRAEQAMQKASVAERLVPAPRDLSPTCVVALRFSWSLEYLVRPLLSRHRIEFDRCCYYPEARNRPSGWAT